MARGEQSIQYYYALHFFALFFGIWSMSTPGSSASKHLSLTSRPSTGGVRKEGGCTGEVRGGIAILSSAMSSWSWEVHAGAIHVNAGDRGGRLVSMISTALLSPLGRGRPREIRSIVESVCTLALASKTELGWGGWYRDERVPM
jgi:hypothetical protein